MRRLIAYGLGVAAAAGAEYLFLYVAYVYVASWGSLDYVSPFYVSLEHRNPSGWDILFGFYFRGASGAVGGLVGLVLTTRIEPRHRWGLSLSQGIIAMFAPLAALDPVSKLLVLDIAVWALAGAIGALLALGLYIAGTAVVRWGNMRRS